MELSAPPARRPQSSSALASSSSSSSSLSASSQADHRTTGERVKQEEEEGTVEHDSAAEEKSKKAVRVRTKSEAEQDDTTKPMRKRRAFASWARKVGQVALTGTAFGADAYLLQVTSMVVPIMAAVYPQNDNDSSMVSTAALLGAMLGQLVFGFIADFVGRRIGFAITIAIFTVGAIASSAVGNRDAIYYLLAFFRLVVGFGVGGEYPLAASIASEKAEDAKRKRGLAVAFTFAMQGVGALMVPLVALLLLLCTSDLDLVWRLCLGLGAVPGVLTLPFRLLMAETGQFRQAKLQEQTMNLSLWKRLVWRGKVMKTYWRELIGTTLSWMLFDALFYGNTLFMPTLLDSMGMADGDTPHERLKNLAELSLIIAAIALPGYAAAVLLIDRIGRRLMQLQGFLGMALLYALISTFYDQFSDVAAVFLILYGATYFFASFGPKMTTFVVPSELYPTEVRAFCHGLSASAGKLGAIIGTYSFKYILSAAGVAVVLNLCAMIAVVGLFVTCLFTPETRLLRLVHGSSIHRPGPPLKRASGVWSSAMVRRNLAGKLDDDEDAADAEMDGLSDEEEGAGNAGNCSSQDALSLSADSAPDPINSSGGPLELRELAEERV